MCPCDLLRGLSDMFVLYLQNNRALLFSVIFFYFSITFLNLFSPVLSNFRLIFVLFRLIFVLICFVDFSFLRMLRISYAAC